MFVPKPDSPCVYIKDNNGPDGCAIFYKNNKFDLLEKHDKILQVWTVHSNQVNHTINMIKYKLLQYVLYHINIFRYPCYCYLKTSVQEMSYAFLQLI